MQWLRRVPVAIVLTGTNIKTAIEYMHSKGFNCLFLELHKDGFPNNLKD